MPQELKQTPITTFTRGLVTEASPLTFPDNASVDELNCTLERTGVRRRRQSLEYESGFSLSSFTFAQGTLIHSLTWENVSKLSSVEFLVTQVGSTLYFYDKSTVPISGNEKSFSVNLNSFSASNGVSIADSRVSGSNTNGTFVVVSPAIESFYIEYDPDTDTISTTVISPKVRDFEWQGDLSGYSEKIDPGIVSVERQYDTYNSGWVDETIGGNEVLKGSSEGYIDRENAWPPLTHPWFSGKDAFGDFDSNVWGKVYGGNSLIGNGRFVLDLYSKDRSAASGVAGITVETETSRFSATASYAGRAWFAGLNGAKNGSKLFFTPVIEDMVQIGNFHQEADPTSEETPDLIDSDGGVINIPAATNIVALFEWNSSLLVFAENGVWEVRGIDGIFKATEFAVSRIREAGGITNIASLVDAEGTPFWWGKSGIFTVQPNAEPTLTSSTVGANLSLSTIQTFWEAIPGDQRADAVGSYDELNNTIYWLYGNDATVKYKYNRVLILDIPLQAFVPWEFEDESSSTNYVVGLNYFSGLGETEETLNVVADGDNVVANGNNVVVTKTVPVTTGAVEVKFLVRDGDTGSLTFATATGTDYLDWGTEDYNSYAEASYDFEDDMTTYKHGVYITTYLELTETGFTGSEVAGYAPINPSSCIMKAFWDLKTAHSSSQEVYRFLRPIVVDTGDLNSFDYPYESVITRNRIRGRGRNLKLRFESSTGKDFRLQGYEVINAKNQGL